MLFSSALGLSCDAGQVTLPLADLPGWARGNLHTHTLWSDGDAYPEHVAQWYKNHGYQFVAVSDHNRLHRGVRWIDVDSSRGGRVAYKAYVGEFGLSWISARMRAGRLQVRLKTLQEYRRRLENDGEFLLVEAEEVTDGYSGAPIHLNVFNPSVQLAPQGGRSVVEVLERNLLAAGARSGGAPGLVQINHPNLGWAIGPQDLTAVAGPPLLEIYSGNRYANSSGGGSGLSAERLWDIALTHRLHLGGDPILGVAVDDAHDFVNEAHPHVNSKPGRGWVVVKVDELTTNSIMEALRTGRFYASTGVRLREIQQEGAVIHIAVEPEPGVWYTIQFIGTLRSDTTAGLDDGRGAGRGKVGVVLHEALGVTGSYEMTGAELYVRVRVYSSARSHDGLNVDEVETAWSQPFMPARP